MGLDFINYNGGQMPAANEAYLPPSWSQSGYAQYSNATPRQGAGGSPSQGQPSEDDQKLGKSQEIRPGVKTTVGADGYEKGCSKNPGCKPAGGGGCSLQSGCHPERSYSDQNQKQADDAMKNVLNEQAPKNPMDPAQQKSQDQLLDETIRSMQSAESQGMSGAPTLQDTGGSQANTALVNSMDPQNQETILNSLMEQQFQSQQGSSMPQGMPEWQDPNKQGFGGMGYA